MRPAKAYKHASEQSRRYLLCLAKYLRCGRHSSGLNAEVDRAEVAVTRTGFERMVAQVCMGQVGAVCAREVSRFARNSRAWQQLVEVCRIVDTLLVDQETVYSPRLGNDRLLLGLNESIVLSACFALLVVSRL